VAPSAMRPPLVAQCEHRRPHHQAAFTPPTGRHTPAQRAHPRLGSRRHRWWHASCFAGWHASWPRASLLRFGGRSRVQQLGRRRLGRREHDHHGHDHHQRDLDLSPGAAGVPVPAGQLLPLSGSLRGLQHLPALPAGVHGNAHLFMPPGAAHERPNAPVHRGALGRLRRGGRRLPVLHVTSSPTTWRG
jgi:hypothetical protein